jgi:hypothetical protein
VNVDSAFGPRARKKAVTSKWAPEGNGLCKSGFSITSAQVTMSDAGYIDLTNLRWVRIGLTSPLNEELQAEANDVLLCAIAVVAM